jgi:hypothetical protein
MRNINFFGSLGDFKDSIGVKQPRRGKNADAQRKTAEAMPLVMQDLAEIRIMEESLPPDAVLGRSMRNRKAQGKKFVYENRLYKTQPKGVKGNKPGK